MELYPKKQFTCTENVNIPEYFKEFSDKILSQTNITKNEEDEEIFAMMGLDLTAQAKQQIKKNFSPDILTVYGEIDCKSTARKYIGRVVLDYKIPKKAYNLKIIQCKEKWKNKSSSLPMHPSPMEFVSQNVDLVPYKDIVVVIKLYQPFQYLPRNKPKLKCSYSIAILASQTLAELRDKLLCNNDLGYCKQLREPNQTTLDASVKDRYPSAFLFIENCFYNDMRHANAIDYSKPIRKWDKLKNHGPFTAGNMETTRIIDLQPSFGYPYLYQHQGDCEHIITFSDIHLLRKSEPLSRSCYPYILTECRENCVICYICGNNIAKFMVKDSDRLPHQYTYLCKTCLETYNYIDGEKIGTFTLYPYFDRAGVLANK